MNTRREFMKKAAVTAAGALLAPTIMKTPLWGQNAPSNRINVAVIGVNGHGMTHVRAYKQQAGKGVNLAAICDVDTAVLDRVAGGLDKEGIKVRTYTDLRSLYENKDIDAVSIVTPNHWHALASIWACEAGKHVCVEKPSSHNIWEGRKMVEAARKYQRMVQADFDSRSYIGLQQGIEYMHKNLGNVRLVRIMNYKRRPSIGKLSGPGMIPPTVNYDLWTGPAPMRSLSRTKIHYDWHWQWLYGNSELGNNGPHQLDICRWALRKSTVPRSVVSFGGRFGYVDDGETPNTQVAIYDYDGIPVVYDSRANGEKQGVDNMDGVVTITATGKRIYHPYKGSANCTIYFICDKGFMMNNVCAETVIYDNDGKEVCRFKPQAVWEEPQFNFIKALRSGRMEDLKCDILDGHLSSCLSHIGNISYQLGHVATKEEITKAVAGEQTSQVFDEMEKHLIANGIDLGKEKFYLGPKLTFDSETERFTGEHAERANLFVKGNYRAPYVIADTL